MYEGVSKSYRTGRLERELQMVQLSGTKCSCISILWVSIVNFAAITLCVASQRVFIILVYFVIGSVRKLLDTASYAYPSELLLSRRVGGPRILYWHGGEENKSSCLCRDSKPGSPLHNLVTVLIELPRLLFCECNTLVMFRMRSVQRMFIVFMTEAVVFQWGNSEIYCSQDNCTILCIIFTACYGVVNQIKGLE
jgi:hypothetical protein